MGEAGRGCCGYRPAFRTLVTAGPKKTRSVAGRTRSSILTFFSISRTIFKFHLKRAQGDPTPDVQSGSVAEIHYTGHVLLEGSFRPD
jgi:hypothetical protein